MKGRLNATSLPPPPLKKKPFVLPTKLGGGGREEILRTKKDFDVFFPSQAKRIIGFEI